MPLDRVDQLPLPNLTLYTFFSGLGLFYVCVYTLSVSDGLYQTFTTDVWCAAVGHTATHTHSCRSLATYVIMKRLNDSAMFFENELHSTRTHVLHVITVL